MNTYTTEDEQVEAIKKWWKDNGLSVAAGVVLGVSLLFGWRAWQEYDQQKAETASMQYEQVLLAVENNQGDILRETANVLLTDYSGSPYATLAALALTKQAVTDDNLDVAHAHLQWVLENGQPAKMQHIARLRKAQLYIDQQQFDAAQQLIAQVQKPGEFASSYAEIKGDIAQGQGNIVQARTAYQEALDSEQLNRAHHELLQMKYDALGQIETMQVIATAPLLPPSADAETNEAATPPTQPIEEDAEAVEPTAALETLDSEATPNTEGGAFQATLSAEQVEPVETPIVSDVGQVAESVAETAMQAVTSEMATPSPSTTAGTHSTITEEPANATQTVATQASDSAAIDMPNAPSTSSALPSQALPNSNITQTHIQPETTTDDASTTAPSSAESTLQTESESVLVTESAPASETGTEATDTSPAIKTIPLQTVTTTHLPAEPANPSTITDTSVTLEPQE